LNVQSDAFRVEVRCDEFIALLAFDAVSEKWVEDLANRRRFVLTPAFFQLEPFLTRKAIPELVVSIAVIDLSFRMHP
jgi:hypothetical protein